MNNRLQFLIRKNAGKRNLEEYKEILSKLIIDNNYSIMCLEDSDIITETVIKNNKLNQYTNSIWSSKQIPFSEKNELKQIISKIRLRYDDMVYMSIKNSEQCGLIVLDRIDFFNVNFQFRDEPSGLIVFYDRSLTNELVVDFYEEYNEHFYDLEILGREWNDIMVQ